MAVLVKTGGAWKTSHTQWVKVAGVWRKAVKVFVKTGGNWEEGFPVLPPPPQSASITQAYANDQIEITANWTAPAGSPTLTKYQVRLQFTVIETGVVSYTSWIDRTPAQLSYKFDNNGVGWQGYGGLRRVRAQVLAWNSQGASLSSALSELETVMKLPAPPAPTGFTVDVQNCDLSQSWAHVGGNRLDNFEIQTWLSGEDITTYKPTKTARSFSGQPWNPATVGRATVNTRIRAVGDGGASAWVTVSGIMPGPVTFYDTRFEGGVLKSWVYAAHDGMKLYFQKYGQTAAHHADYNNTISNPFAIAWTASSGFAADATSRYRFVVTPRNSVNEWTGRAQGSTYCIKIPNPVFIRSTLCNTWWSIPIPGKWRDNPQAEDWFYQGKSISGNSVGTLFYSNRVKDYFDGLGYRPSVTAWDVYYKRAAVGGLVAPVQLSVWIHNTKDDSVNASPSMVYGPFNGPSLARNQQAWVRMPTTWLGPLYDGDGQGLSVYVSPSAADNQLRPEIGNVSNRYMILEKPEYAGFLDGQPVGTLRIYHDG